jgi:hypothetical protein
MSRQGRIGPGQQWSAGWPSRIRQELNHPSSDALARAWSIAAIAPALAALADRGAVSKDILHVRARVLAVYGQELFLAVSDPGNPQKVRSGWVEIWPDFWCDAGECAIGERTNHSRTISCHG